MTSDFDKNEPKVTWENLVYHYSCKLRTYIPRDLNMGLKRPLEGPLDLKTIFHVEFKFVIFDPYTGIEAL